MMGITMKAELAPAGMVKDNDCRPSVKSAGRAAAAQELGAIDLVLIATGLLHDDDMKPEKTWRSLEPAAMMRAFEINTIGPALIAKHVLPRKRARWQPACIHEAFSRRLCH